MFIRAIGNRIEIVFDLPAGAVDSALAEYRQAVKSRLPKSTAAGGNDDVQLAEARHAFLVADAKLAEGNARKMTATVEGDAKKLAGIIREIAAAETAAAEAKSVLDCASHIANLKRAETTATADANVLKIQAEVGEMLRAEITKLEAELTKAIRPLAGRLVSLRHLNGAMQVAELGTLQNFAAGLL